jgi:excinuclease ABC subunit B
MSRFKLMSSMKPAGDQPRAIGALSTYLQKPCTRQTLLGVTGSGKTFTAAHLVETLQLPTLVVAHNKILAAQLYGEFKSLFPENAVGYFVSYYDYYQPEAYVPSSDTYIEKDSSINDAIDRMRHASTQALFTRNDVIIVSSVSCIYGIGSADTYGEMVVKLQRGDTLERDLVIKQLVEMQFERNDVDFHRSTFRVRGDRIEVMPAHEQERAIRIDWFGDEIEEISVIDPLRGKKISSLETITIYPSSHYVTNQQTRVRAMKSIREELLERLQVLRSQSRLLEAQRLEERTLYDLEILEQMGYCSGIENYSRHLTGRAPGVPPPTLLDYFGDQFLLLVDESHQTLPQIGGMYKGDRSRKENLVKHGFRLPSALDNRPLRFDEFDALCDRVVYISATPGEYELEQCEGVVVEQVIRPTGLVDPPIEVRPVGSQVDDLLEEIRLTTNKGYRTLVTTLTKRMAEDLSEYYGDLGLKVRYMHSDIDTLERIEILQELREGAFDVLVGINLLREGLDIPEVALVGILDADKEGFLRSERSLIQTIGRAARNVDAKVVLYGDRITKSMRGAIEETKRRREKQIAHNKKHGITPKTIKKSIERVDLLTQMPSQKASANQNTLNNLTPSGLHNMMEDLRRKMFAAAESLDFERAALLRDQLKDLEQRHLMEDS